MKKLILMFVLILCGCNFNVAYVEKNIYIENSEEIEVDMTGSNLTDWMKNNKQEADGKLHLPKLYP